MNDMFKESSQISRDSQKSVKRSIWSWFKNVFVSKSSEPMIVQDIANELSEDGKENTKKMLVNLSTLQKLRLDSISVPKADIIALSDESSFEEVIEVFRTSTFTRVPVYSDTLDNPLGLIHLKDFALGHGFGSSNIFNMKSV